MKSSIDAYAVFGGAPIFSVPAGVGQENRPKWEDIEHAFRAIFDRRYFANNGPLVRELDDKIAGIVAVRHAICVTNEMVGAMVLARALDISGDVVMPATAAATFVEAFRLAGLRPVFCDVDAETFAPTLATFDAVVTKETQAFAGAHMFGRSGLPEQVELRARESGILVVLDAGTSIDCAIGDRKIGSFGAAELFSFQSTGFENGGQGAAITTNDELLAARMRTIRNFHPSQTFAPARLRINGKMSEAQAALVIVGLRSSSDFALANQQRYTQYVRHLNPTAGIKLLPMPAQSSMCARVVISIDEDVFGLSRDRLRDILLAENISTSIPLSVRCPGFDGADYLARTLLEVPNGQLTTIDDVGSIGRLIVQISHDARTLTAALDNQS